MKTNARNYNVKDVNLMIAADTIVSHAINHKEFLQSKRAVWADPFFEDFQTRINNAIQTYLGADNAAQLRQSTQKVHEILEPVRTLLAEIRIQIVEDFKKTPATRDEILNTLGFSSLYGKVSNNDQEATVELLYRFKNGLTDELQKKITEAGTAAESLNALKDHAEKFKDAEVAQETNKGKRKVITAEAVAEFNAIYDQLVSVNRIASKFFKGDKSRQELFSFSKITKSLSGPTRNTPQPTS
ncbi:MAG: hypothetical protein CFE23_14605 [Flavobacterium sp. BFFFF1]|uniref:hypothetical protein n=1 Tax=Flavobacterium sp. BFFFF1 TaxID=2015557 RepID=UPI000BD40F7F|nr:hypothetical protein [Flavobacterium sp. BFFFF1]OYU79333.1 MAG: hypothetical protein CFE23_14605 [Flavobacterium sp. BFFFF1]